MKENILFICGSLNQTTIMHKISRHLREFNSFFTPFYADGLIDIAGKAGLTEFSILGGKHRQATEAYLENEGLDVDYGGKKHNYDMVVTGTDLIIQNNILNKRLMLVQEGMTEEEDILYQLVRYWKFPRFVANTAATGLSNQYDMFCVASKGYRELFVRKGVDPDKIIVTGIPNFDNAAQYLDNDFPYHDYALVATSSIRETLKPDDRDGFLRFVKEKAFGNRVIFKLHPNENTIRATKEIRKYFPNELIYSTGNVHHMIANCESLYAQNSSVIYTALALGKKTYSYLDNEKLTDLIPVQNGGQSAEKIAEICRRMIFTPLSDIKQKGRKTRQIKKQLESSNLI